MQAPRKYTLIPHTADIQVRVYGATKQELFTNAVIAMFQSIGPRTPGCWYEGDYLVCSALPVNHTVSIQAPNDDILLIDFLSELLYLSDVHNEAYLDATIKALTNTQIDAIIHGVPVLGFEVVEIKAVTYHAVAITQHEGLWQTDIVFDI